jgi:hypothetical protein
MEKQKLGNLKLTPNKNIMKFNASIVNIAKDENDVLVIGFMENESYNNYLTIQYSNDFDEQDLSLNWSKYYIDLSNKGGCYNCITEINIAKNSIEIMLNEHGNKKLKTNQIVISYFLGVKEYANLLETIRTVFEDESKVKLNIL